MMLSVKLLPFPVPATGWVPDDEVTDSIKEVNIRDAPLGVEGKVSTGIEIDNRKFFLNVSQQANWPSCTANACCDLWEAVEVHSLVGRGMALNTAKTFVPDKSRMFAWWNGRNEMSPNRSKDAGSGCYNRLIMDIVGRHGLPKEATWPYDNAVVNANGEPRTVARPSIAAYREAFRSRSKGSYKIFDEDTKRVERCIQTLQVLPGIAFGTALGNQFGLAEDNVLQPEDNGARHAMVIVGWSSAKGAFLVRNSWGTGFGMEGYCWMSADYIAWKKTGSLWVVTG